jgi:hypothetical protein
MAQRVHTRVQREAMLSNEQKFLHPVTPREGSPLGNTSALVREFRDSGYEIPRRDAQYHLAIAFSTPNLPLSVLYLQQMRQGDERNCRNFHS